MNWWAYARFGGLDDRVAAGVRVAVGDVVGDRVLEQDRLLEHDADLAAEAAERDVADVVAVDPDGARIDVPEPREQVHQGRLAAAVGADQRDRLAVPDGRGSRR